MTNSFEWILELKDSIDISKYMNNDYNDMIEQIGLENTLKLIERCQRTTIYFSTSPIDKLKALYVLQHKSEDSKVLARKLKVSERFVQKVCEKNNIEPDNFDLFKEGDNDGNSD